MWRRSSMLGVAVAVFCGCFSEAPEVGDGDTGQPTGADGSGADGSGSATSVGPADGDTVGAGCAGCTSGFCLADGTCARGIFVSSAQYTADLGGLTGADDACNELADAAALGGQWRAWLSDSNVSVASRISGLAIPYALRDGTQVVEQFADFSTYVDIDTQYLLHPIALDEYGEVVGSGTACTGTAFVPVWTSTTPDSGGLFDGQGTCGDWTSTGLSKSPVGLGTSTAVDSLYSAFACSETDCSRTASLYCVQVSEP